MAKRSFRIEFIRKVQDSERNYNNLMWYDEEGGLIFDMTEFDSEYQTNEVLFVDLINLFNDFCEENSFEDVTVTDMTEVTYDGEE